MEVVNILTAVTRPENLPVIRDSVIRAARDFVKPFWHLRFDPDLQHVGGQALKNEMIGSIDKGWCWILDDDTIAHPLLFKRTEEFLRDPSLSMVVVSQIHGEGCVRRACPENMRLGRVDAGQVLFRREAVLDRRIPEEYDGDGKFLEGLSVLPAAYVDEPLSYYNYLRPEAC